MDAPATSWVLPSFLRCHSGPRSVTQSNNRFKHIFLSGFRLRGRNDGRAPINCRHPGSGSGTGMTIRKQFLLLNVIPGLTRNPENSTGSGIQSK